MKKLEWSFDKKYESNESKNLLESMETLFISETQEQLGDLKFNYYSGYPYVDANTMKLNMEEKTLRDFQEFKNDL